MLVNCARLFRLDVLLQAYRCSSEWKTTIAYIYCNMYFCEYSNVARGIKVTVQHRGGGKLQRIGSILSDKAGVTSEMKQSSYSGENFHKPVVSRTRL